jgi:hypothetical protein
MLDNEFKTNVDTLIDNKLEKHKNLQEQSSFYWSEIELGTLKFDRKEIEVAELRKLTKQDLIYFFDKLNMVVPEEKDWLCKYMEVLTVEHTNIPSLLTYPPTKTFVMGKLLRQILQIESY